MRRRSSSKKGLVALTAAALLLAALLGLLTGVPPAPAPPSAGLPVRSAVAYVYDGDTIRVAGVGKVRIIGIDAMDGYNMERAAEQSREYGMPVGVVKRWAEEATRFARKTLDREEVTLQPGPEAHDRYGRTLAYVAMGKGGQDFGLLMIRKGLAAAYGVFPHPRRARYRRAEEAAEDQRVGMWKDATIRP